MELFPAIDLQGGACVRLRQGDFAEATRYDADPLDAARRFEAAGAKWLHVVDLDGAKDGAARQTGIIEKLAKQTTLNVQTGGGIRSEEDVDTLLGAGVKRVVVGSLAVQEPDKVHGWMKRFGGERLVLALDVRVSEVNAPEVLTRGWQAGSGLSLWEALGFYADVDLQTVLCTDVGRDGMMTGPNLALYAEMQKRFPAIDVLASGGVGSLKDIRDLAQMGLKGAIMGKALYEKKFSLTEAIGEVRDAG